MVDGLFEVSVGGADDAGVGAEGFVGADAFEFAFLEYAEEFYLYGGREVADFVEEEGASGGLFDASFSGADGSGEGTFFVAEEFGFEESFA